MAQSKKTIENGMNKGERRERERWGGRGDVKGWGEAVLTGNSLSQLDETGGDTEWCKFVTYS